MGCTATDGGVRAELADVALKSRCPVCISPCFPPGSSRLDGRTLPSSATRTCPQICSLVVSICGSATTMHTKAGASLLSDPMALGRRINAFGCRVISPTVHTPRPPSRFPIELSVFVRNRHISPRRRPSEKRARWLHRAVLFLVIICALKTPLNGPFFEPELNLLRRSRFPKTRCRKARSQVHLGPGTSRRSPSRGSQRDSKRWGALWLDPRRRGREKHRRG